MKQKIKAAITTWLGLDVLRAELCAELSDLNSKATSARSQLVELNGRLAQAEAQLSGLEAQAAGHAERVSRVEMKGLPVRYVQTDTGLQEVR